MSYHRLVANKAQKNRGTNFQSKVEPVFTNIREQIKAWVDDLVLHCRTEEDLFDTLLKFFIISREANLKISITKCQIFRQLVRWCGQIIESKGVQFDPRNQSGLQGIELPISAGELCEYVQCLPWMSYSIPNLPNRISPLKKALSEAYTKSGSGTMKYIQRIQLSSLTWEPEHKAVFRNFQDEIKNMARLAHRDPKNSMLVYRRLRCILGRSCDTM